MISRDDLDAIRARWLAKQSDPSDLAAVLYLFDELEDAHERMTRERDEARANLSAALATLAQIAIAAGLELESIAEDPSLLVARSARALPIPVEP
jgi:hypothetical protein